jgi:hypothetical protein
MVRGASKRISFHLHTPHVFFNGTVLVRGLVLALATRRLCGCGAELLVRRMGWACDGVGGIGGRLRRRLLGSGAADDDKATALLFAVEDWTQERHISMIGSRKCIRLNAYVSACGR